MLDLAVSGLASVVVPVCGWLGVAGSEGAGEAPPECRGARTPLYSHIASLRNLISILHRKETATVQWTWVTCAGAQGLFMSRSRNSEKITQRLFSEGADDLTLRAEEVKTLKACINIDHIEDNRWGPPLVGADGHAFCQASYKGRRMGRAVLSLHRDE